MAAGNPVIAHDNAYNRWVVENGAVYFSTEDDVADRLDEILTSPTRLEQMSAASLRRYEAEFTWERVAGQYEQLLLRFLPDAGLHSSEPVAMEMTS
jgi:glycosyltransferase involved in cell wall biosynthesis